MTNETTNIETEVPTQQVAPNNDLLVCAICEAEFDPLYEGATTTEGREICWNCQSDIACGCAHLAPDERIIP